MKTARYAKTQEAQTYDTDEFQKPEDTYWHRSQEVYNIKFILSATETTEQVCSGDNASDLY